MKPVLIIIIKLARLYNSKFCHSHRTPFDENENIKHFTRPTHISHLSPFCLQAAAAAVAAATALPFVCRKIADKMRDAFDRRRLFQRVAKILNGNKRKCELLECDKLNSNDV